MAQTTNPPETARRRRFSYLRLNVDAANVGSWIVGGFIFVSGLAAATHAPITGNAGANDIMGGLFGGAAAWYLIRWFAEVQRIFLENAENLRTIAQRGGLDD